jgi:hypothetical protein
MAYSALVALVALVVSGCHKRASASNDSNDSHDRPPWLLLRAGYAQATRRLRGC